MQTRSKNIITILVLIIIALCIYMYMQAHPRTALNNTSDTAPEAVSVPITISEEKITESNFTGTRPVIMGTGALASAARVYVDQTIASFKQQADQDVPDIRIQFGSDSPTSNYTIDITAKYIKDQKTESIILDEYVYTGGANGSSMYKVFTASLSNGKLLSLSDVIESSKQQAFVSLVKKELIAWRPDGGTQSPVFKEQVDKITFASLEDWSFDKDSIVIYFDKYDIGPGALGAVAFPISRAKITSYLTPSY